MQPGHLIDIQTPKKFKLKGFWLGASRARKAVILVHGLGGSAFGSPEFSIAGHLADGKTAAIIFNNRGHDVVSKLYREAKTKKGYERIIAGGAHEVFTDCVDDIQGAIDFAKRMGVKEIYLAGHSTGCQKSMYWASKSKRERSVKGIVLLAPISDYSSDVKSYGKEKIDRIATHARAMMKAGKAHELLPDSLSTGTWDAQRFLSLFTLESTENIFSYANPEKDPKILKSVRVPMLVLLAEHDEYGDMPAKAIAAWFEANLKGAHEVRVIPKVLHGFKGAEKAIAGIMKSFINS